MRSEVLVDTITRSRRPLIAAPRIDSEAPSEYTSAVSKKLTPASRLMSTMRRACSTPVLPQALNSGPLPPKVPAPKPSADRSEEHTSELQSLMRSSYAVFCLKKKNIKRTTRHEKHTITTH